MRTPVLQTELLKKGNSLGSILTEGANQIVIGSSKRADLVLPGNSSAIHALLRLTAENQIILFDLGSENGTFVSGKKVVEQRLGTGESFSIGEHEIRVKLLTDPQVSSPFWAETPTTNETLLIHVTENGITHQEFSLSRGQKLSYGSRRRQILLPGHVKNGEFLKRAGNEVRVILPRGYSAEIYSPNNKLLRKSEVDCSFHEGEKMRLIATDADREVLCYWQAVGMRQGRVLHDGDELTLKKSIAGSIVTSLAIASLFFMALSKREQVTEASFPKSSYERITMESAPSAPAPAASAPAPASSEKADPKPKGDSTSSSLAKILEKKSSFSLNKIQEALSRSGKETSRDNAKSQNSNLQQKEISVAGGATSINVSSVKAGLGNALSGSALKGFSKIASNGIGESLGYSNGKGFDMKVGEEEAETVGGLDKSQIAAVVQANIGQIKHCYEKQLIIDPTLSGKIIASWTISANGTVKEANVKSTTMKNQQVENCIIGKIKTWNFPNPKGGGVVLVSYPFLFKALK